MTCNPILKINLDELSKEQLTQLASTLIDLGQQKEAMKVEHYIKVQKL